MQKWSIYIWICRKSQAKKVVCIPAPAPANSRQGGEIVPSDLWAWRKYGQKPIKGSPYPRSVITHTKLKEHSFCTPALTMCFTLRRFCVSFVTNWEFSLEITNCFLSSVKTSLNKQAFAKSNGCFQASLEIKR